jgi:DNA-directed RNA polymerase subunit H (RpoH/RPB5)
VALVSRIKYPTRNKMHILQPKHTKLSEKEAQELINKLNISKSQLPKIILNDVGLPENCNIGDVIKIERIEGEKINLYYRVVV